MQRATAACKWRKPSICSYIVRAESTLLPIKNRKPDSNLQKRAQTKNSWRAVGRRGVEMCAQIGAAVRELAEEFDVMPASERQLSIARSLCRRERSRGARVLPRADGR